MNKKYRLTKNTKVHFGITLFQIEATADFADVKKGEVGGWVEKEENLSQKDNAWVYSDALVSGNARVYGEIKLQFGWCFGRKRKDWNVTELENEEEILLIKDYKPVIEK